MTKAVPKLDEKESGQMGVVETLITLAHSVSEKLIFTVVADNLFLWHCLNFESLLCNQRSCVNIARIANSVQCHS